VPCSIMKVFKRRVRPREPLLVMMAPLDQVLPDQTHMEVETLAPTHMEAETLVLIPMEAETLVRADRADMEETAEATITTTRRVVLV